MTKIQAIKEAAIDCGFVAAFGFSVVMLVVASAPLPPRYEPAKIGWEWREQHRDANLIYLRLSVNGQVMADLCREPSSNNGEWRCEVLGHNVRWFLDEGEERVKRASEEFLADVLRDASNQLRKR